MMALAMLMGYALDLLIGDPSVRYHPAQIVARMIHVYESKLSLLSAEERQREWFLAMAVLMDTFFIVFLMGWAFSKVHPYLDIAISAIFIYSAVSIQGIAQQVRKIRDQLGAGDLAASRRTFQAVTGLDAQALNEQQMIRQSIVITANATLRGAISPLFYAAVGGAALSMAYRASSTLAVKQHSAGEGQRPVAVVDAGMNAIPQMMYPLLVQLAGWFGGLRGTLRKLPDGLPLGQAGVSKRAAVLESFSDILSLSNEKGEAMGQVCLNDISRAIHLMYLTSFLALLSMVGFRLLCWQFT